MPELTSQRHLFDIPDDVAYFNCASRTPFLKAVAAAAGDGLTNRLAPWAWDPAVVADRVGRVRGRFAGLIGAGADDIAICPSASYGLATAARNLSIEQNQTIIVLADQFPSNVFIWMEKAQEAGAEVLTVPRPSDGDWTSAVLERIDGRTAIAALPPCHWADGGTLDLITIGGALRTRGAALVVDATQWVGAAPFDAGATRADYLVAAAYKWLCCPNGMALMYVAPDRHGGRPFEHNDYNHPATAASIEGDLVYDMSYPPGARRFDVGQTQNLTLIPMALAALDQVAAWTPQGVADGLRPVIDRVAETAAEMGFQLPPAAHRSPHFISLSRPAPAPGDLIPRLAAAGVYAAKRCGGLRLAPHLYVSDQDVDHLFQALAEAWP